MKKLQLILTDPCSQQWDDMQPAGVGRYCESCEKDILDLTDKSDAELIQFFKKKKDNVCGRLLASQLNREMVLPPSKAGWPWLLPMAIGAIAISPAQANELRPVMVQSDLAPALPQSSVQSAPKSPLVAITIRGRVVNDQTGEPLKGVKVRQKGFQNVLALTDSAGKFELGIAEGKMASAFTFELNGYSRVEMHLNDKMVVKLTVEQPVMLLGAISTIAVNQEPLYLVYAGKKSCSINASRLKEIPPDWIEKVDILKDAKATSLYGAKAANGVVLIEIKKAYAKQIDFSQQK